MKKNKPHPLNPFIEFNDMDAPPIERSFEEFLLNRKDFYKPYLEKRKLSFPNVDAEKGADQFFQENPEFVDVIRKSIAMFHNATVEDSYSYADITNKYEKCLQELECVFKESKNKEAIKLHYINELDKQIRALQLKILLPGFATRTLKLLNYHLQVLINVRDFMGSYSSNHVIPNQQNGDSLNDKNNIQQWRGIPLTEIRTHLDVFTKRKSRNNRPFLSKEELNIFINRAFLNMNEGPIEINFSTNEKGFIIKRFYELFDLAIRKHSEVNKKKPYIDLILNNITNLGTEKSIEALFKPNKCKQTW